MKSMTGFGKRETEWKGLSVGVELKSVNHRYCEVVARLPRSLVGAEEDLKQIIHRQCERGRIEYSVSINAIGHRQKSLVLDRAAAGDYHRLLKELQRELHLEGPIDVGLIAGFRDVMVVKEQSFDEKGTQNVVARLTKGALTDLNAMRTREGKALLEDTVKRLQAIRLALKAIERRVPDSVQEHFERMKKRVTKLLGENPSNLDRLHQELATYADRCDITEELTRLASHLSQFQESSKAKGAIGRRLDFLLQEMGREINTIGSKANDADIALQVVTVKSELEKIREQVQNIE
ncbi:MAG: YicC/YloC family endoribonuclease [Nitrospirales bacterium]